MSNGDRTWSSGSAGLAGVQGQLGHLRGWFVVLVLTAVYSISFVDRQILSLLVEPVRADLHVSDTQMGVLQGLAFALFYTFMGIPLARLADRGNRRNLIIGGVLLWCLMTSLCGFAQSYLTLFLARIGVGVGEAALSPAAYSLIADSVPRERLSRAISVYGMGVYFGGGLAYIAGGSLVERVAQGTTTAWPIVGALRPWQLTFVIVGLAGLCALPFLMAMQEPPRRVTHTAAVAAPVSVPLSQLLAFARGRARALTGHFAGFSMLALVGYGILFWLPTQFIRSFGWSPAEVGYPLGLMLVVFGNAGIFAGGALADRLVARGRADGPIVVGLIGGVGLLLGGGLAPLANTPALSLALWCPTIFFVAFPFGAAPAALQMQTPNRMRAQVSAGYLFAINIIGLGFGPASIGMATDFLFADDAALPLSLSLVAVLFCALGVGALAWCRRDFAVLPHEDRQTRGTRGV